MRARIRGHYYTVEFKNPGPKYDGDCDHPNAPDKVIRIRPGVKSPSRLLELCIHEGLHAAFWDLDEQSVTDASRDIANLVVKVMTERLPKVG